MSMRVGGTGLQALCMLRLIRSPTGSPDLRLVPVELKETCHRVICVRGNCGRPRREWRNYLTVLRKKPATPCHPHYLRSLMIFHQHLMSSLRQAPHCFSPLLPMRILEAKEKAMAVKVRTLHHSRIRNHPNIFQNQGAWFFLPEPAA